MYCCLCHSIDAPENRICKLCNRVFCFECIEIEKLQKLYLLSKNNVCIFCRIRVKIHPEI